MLLVISVNCLEGGEDLVGISVQSQITTRQRQQAVRSDRHKVVRREENTALCGLVEVRYELALITHGPKHRWKQKSVWSAGPVRGFNEGFSHTRDAAAGDSVTAQLVSTGVSYRAFWKTYITKFPGISDCIVGVRILPWALYIV